MSFHTHYIERGGKALPVEVEYEFFPPRPATLFQPSEGGVEILGVESATVLSSQEREKAEQAAIDAAWRMFNEPDGYESW